MREKEIKNDEFFKYFITPHHIAIACVLRERTRFFIYKLSFSLFYLLIFTYS